MCVNVQRLLCELRFACDYNHRSLESLHSIPPALVALMCMLFALVLSNLMRSHLAETKKNKVHNFFPHQRLLLAVHAALSFDVSVPVRKTFRVCQEGLCQGPAPLPVDAAEMMAMSPNESLDDHASEEGPSPVLVTKALQGLTTALHLQLKRSRGCSAHKKPHDGGPSVSGCATHFTLGGMQRAPPDEDISQPVSAHFINSKTPSLCRYYQLVLILS